MFSWLPCCSSTSNEKNAPTERRLRANDREYNAQFKYADNVIKTSKYNIITFIPQNLFEQFQRIANFYFLVLMILQFIPQISSISWYSTAVPLVIVLAFSAIKDGYDDAQRHISDRNVNGRKSYVVRNGSLCEEDWSNVKVGDVIRMMSNQFVAADLLLLSTSEPYGVCFIETMELDGETNLKNRAAIACTQEMGDDLDGITRFDGEIICEPPNNKLDKFNGKLIWNNHEYGVNNDNILLRGCILKNTRWCYGVVVFAGKDTKLMMNSGKTKFKRTSLDRFLNILIVGIVLFLIAMCLICTILCAVWEYQTGRYFTIYLPWDDVVPSPEQRGGRQIALIAFLQFFSYIILLNTVVPISLYVSVEIIRFIHSLWINYDTQMYYENGEKSVPAKAHTTTLNEELGQVQYVFSDKTGTLTRNIMTFNKCTINGISYGDIYDHKGEVIETNDKTKSLDFSWNSASEPTFKFFDKNLVDATKRQVPEIDQFWRLLALCHTVMPERDKGQLVYQAQSPDEHALTSAARNFGYVFRARTPQSITIEVMGNEETHELLAILDFNNDRKRMSVIVKGPDGKIRLYCKGADMMIMQRIHPSTSQIMRTSTNTHLADFANIGLRTLCLGYKDLDPAYFSDWDSRVKKASAAMQDRESAVDALYEEIEKDLILIGATAIEDKLQDGVPEAIARLSEANIKIWVLTGDKTETAINIAYSCRLLTDETKEIVVVDGQTDTEVEVQLKDTRNTFEQILALPSPLGGKPRIEIETIHEESEAISSARSMDRNIVTPDLKSAEMAEHESGGVALVINGDSLAFALGPRLERTFLEVACMCNAVICCRVTPLQKAQVVDLVKRNKKAVTLSIGDGANDVSMIKTAHIGVGISGQEGMQAVLASDYSIGQFKYLERLLLVHGRWSYIRMAKFLRYFFYKNFAFTLTNFWYSFFCGYSAQTVFDAVLIACYNLFFTALPVLAMGSLDQDVDDHYSLRYPKLYLPGQFNLFFNMRIFIYSVLHGMFSSLVIFFIPYGAFYNAAAASGKDLDDYSALAFTTFTALVVVVTGQIAFDTSYWTAISHFVIWGSLVLYFLVCFLLYEWLPVSWIVKTSSSISYGVAFRTMVTPHFWFSILMVSVVLLLPVMLNRFFWLDTHPSFADRLRIRKKMGKKPSAKDDKKTAFKRTAATRRSVRGSLRSGYAFSHSQGFGELILKGKLFKNVENLRGKNNSNAKIHPTSDDLQPMLISSVPDDSQGASSINAMHLPMGTRPQNVPHTLNVNTDDWSQSSDFRPAYAKEPSPLQGTVIRGDGRSHRNHVYSRETQVEEQPDVITRL
ncbi:Phospholipid-transporting ATPase [Caenorhabditis elegans]|nr:Phospholipid-transporting ATPase [Caenorhabditis elegans]CCD72226.1 Phospholipid-transporting ATPase [Caenorhabditis elegans]|eukprot:NP_001023252.2 Phospholipid-transporting ATPase [Caenorhabditis elegans]